MEAPNLSKLNGTLVVIERVLSQLVAANQGQKMINTAPVSVEAEPIVALVSVPRTQWASRDEAYATLEAIADYLSRIEPHSPTPYLLRRAVNWGRMPLPELMAEIVREEGDLNRLGQILGLNK
jgi:type VI secretion system protein ImpA